MPYPPRQRGSITGSPGVPFERRFETAGRPPGPVDLAVFNITFEVERVVWLLSMVLDHSRWLRGRFVAAFASLHAHRRFVDQIAARVTRTGGFVVKHVFYSAPCTPHRDPISI
jgi:hypothetical protein